MSPCRKLVVIGYLLAGRLLAPVVAGAQTPAPDPAAILAATREALGGDQRLSAVKAFVATGRTRQVRGDNLVPIEFEISCERPDKYIRRDEIPAQENGPTTTGFNGNALIQIPPPSGPPGGRGPMPPGRAGGPPPPPPTPAQLEAQRTARVATLKQDVTRLLLGLFADSFATFPLTFTYAGTAEAPQGQADVLEVKGAANFAARLFVYKTTHLPIMVTWQAPPGPPPGGPGRGAGGPGGPPPPGAPPGAPGTGAPVNASQAQMTPMVETRVYFADYRDVDGVKWPFRIRRAVGTDTVEETTFDRFRINAKIDPKKFDAK